MRLLLTGADGFTGQHLLPAAQDVGYEVFSLMGDLQDADGILRQIEQIQPTHVIHLAGISHATDKNELAYYQVNLLGTLTLLKCLATLATPPQKIILASSAHIYGDCDHSPIAETEPPAPISHYAMSKLAMEYMSRPFLAKLPIVIVRPFNYTGVGHSLNFVIPKIVDHFKRKAPVIELGNIDVFREYNDVRDICDLYLKLLEMGNHGETYNLASGRAHRLRDVLSIAEGLSNHTLLINVNPNFIRPNEIERLTGDPSYLYETIGVPDLRSIEETLQWMLTN